MEYIINLFKKYSSYQSKLIKKNNFSENIKKSIWSKFCITVFIKNYKSLKICKTVFNYRFFLSQTIFRYFYF